YYFVKWANEKAKIWNDASLSEDNNLKKVLTEFLSEHQFTEPCTTAHGTWHITKISNGSHLCIFIKGA
ncbi:hypothetical protein, partial [Streptococcus pneumoniae]|uniref:hypothetical protein n=1 Tax=Streptococcus pneumoniae TaxID=1313 RepID=UPI001E37CB04